MGAAMPSHIAEFYANNPGYTGPLPIEALRDPSKLLHVNTTIGTTAKTTPRESPAPLASSSKLEKLRIVAAAQGFVVETKEVRKNSKYRNTRVKLGDQWFDSIDEALRFLILRSDPTVSDLRPQVPYQCEVNGYLIATYRADFVYCRDGVEVVEDVKSEKTRKLPQYRLKKRLVKACFGVEIQEYSFKPAKSKKKPKADA